MLDHWYKKFGPLYSLWLGNQLFVIISDPGIAKDLFVTNGATFSSVSLIRYIPTGSESDILAAQGDVRQV